MDAIPGHAHQLQMNTNCYDVEHVPVDAIKSSPENDKLYGEVTWEDDTMHDLVASIDELGLEEPLILSVDYWLISGHRRFEACKDLGMETIPCRVKRNVRRADYDQLGWMKILTAYNPQRVKSVGAILREAILRDTTPGEELEETVIRLKETNEPTTIPEYTIVTGEKDVEPLSESKRDILRAVKVVTERLKKYWPLTLRQIHYQLLNDPPLWRIVNRSKFDPEHYRYKNDNPSYEALVRLCVSARYEGEISWASIDDTTRISERNAGFTSVHEFIQKEMESFMRGYHRDKQFDQPVYLMVLYEKNTLASIVRPICKEYYVPMIPSRGFGGPSLWYRMANAFRASGKSRMVLLVVSDYDPEGLALARDAVRSLRDLWDIPIDYHRVAVTDIQIKDQGLYGDFNPAKPLSTHLDAFIEETGGTETWECEALDPEYLQDELRSAILANMNLEIFQAAREKELEEIKAVQKTRAEIARNFGEK